MKRHASLLIITGMLAGCGTSPDPGYFSLGLVSGMALSDVTYVVKIQRPSLPGYLDRPDIVEQDSTYQVRINEEQRWAESLDTMFERILAQDLRQRLPTATIITEDDETTTVPRVTIGIEIQQFNKVNDGKALLQAQLNIWDQGTHEQPQPQHIQYVLDTGSSASSLAESLSQLIGKTADGIAVLLHDQAVKGKKVVPVPPDTSNEE